SSTAHTTRVIMQQSCCAIVSCGDRIDASRRAHGRLRKEARQHSALLISPRARFELATSYRYAGGDPRPDTGDRDGTPGKTHASRTLQTRDRRRGKIPLPVRTVQESAVLRQLAQTHPERGGQQALLV